MTPRTPARRVLMTHEKAYDTAYDLYLNYMKQHVEGFNFFLVVSGLLINALIDVFDKGYSPVVLYLLCGFEAVVSLVFFRSTRQVQNGAWILLRITHSHSTLLQLRI
jgi:hypothetical protein